MTAVAAAPPEIDPRDPGPAPGEAVRRRLDGAAAPARRQRRGRRPRPVNGSPGVVVLHRRHRDGRRDGRGRLPAHRRRHRHSPCASGVPVIGLWHSGGARLAEGVEALHAVGLRLRGDDPRLRAGPADLGRARPGRRRRRLRPGADRRRDHVHRRAGVRHRARRRPLGHRRERRHGVPRRRRHPRPAQRRRARRHRRRGRGARRGPVGHRRCWPGQGAFDLDQHRPGRATSARCCPDNPKRAYDVHPLVAGVLDEGGFLELHAKWAPNIVTGLRPADRPHRRRHRQQPAAAGRLPRLAVGARRRPASCGCATRSGSRSSCSSTCPATCPASARSGTASSAAAPSCCTRSARRSCRGSRW